MALQHLQLFAVFEADDVFRCHRPADGNRRGQFLRFEDGLRGSREGLEAVMHVADQAGQFGRRDLIPSYVAGDDGGSLFQEFGHGVRLL